MYIMKKYDFMKVAGRLFMGVSLFALAACNDFLDEEPQSDVSPEQYLWSEDQLKAYVDNYYADYDNYDGDSDDKGGMLPSHYGSENGSPYYDDDATDNQQGTNGRYLQDTWTVGQTGGKWNFTNIYALNYFIETVTPRYEEALFQDRLKTLNSIWGRRISSAHWNIFIACALWVISRSWRIRCLIIWRS